MSRPTSTESDAEDLAAAWRDLEARGPRLRSDPKLARLAVELARALGNRASQRDLLQTIAEAWPNDPELTLGATALLIEQADRRGTDEPIVSDDAPARRAARALRGCIDALGEAAREDPAIAGPLYVALGNALRLSGADRDAASRAAFEEALKLDPTRALAWFDLALLHKWRGRFEEGFEANQRALELGAPRRPVLWNAAICATALGRGEAACDAWRQLGMPAETDAATGMPFVEGLPPLLVRVLSRPSPVDGTSAVTGVGFELVWVAPLSPCHGVLQSPTFRDAPIDYGDLVLWDGAPVAEHRVAGDEAVPVFALLEILRRGEERRWPFVALEREAGALQALERALPKGARLFIQQERLAEHVPAGETEKTAGNAPEPAPPEKPLGFSRGKIIVGADTDLRAFQRAWEGATRSKTIVAVLPKLYESLGETKRAGQEHQAWRGVERTVLREREGT